MIPPPMDKIKEILRKTFIQYPPKFPPKWWKKEQKRKQIN